MIPYEGFDFIRVIGLEEFLIGGMIFVFGPDGNNIDVGGASVFQVDG